VISIVPVATGTMKRYSAGSAYGADWRLIAMRSKIHRKPQSSARPMTITATISEKRSCTRRNVFW
jgi:hypothetical protein